MNHRRFRRWACAAALLCSGCFAYVPIEPTALPPVGNDIRLELTRVGFAELPELPNYSGPDLEGALVRADGDQLFLSVPVAVRSNGVVLQTVDQQVAIPRRNIVRMERRAFNRPKTFVSIGGGLALLAGVFLGFKAGGNDTPEIPEQTQEEEAGSRMVAPLFSIPFSLFP